MYFNDHAPPHFHAEYGGDEAVFSLASLSVIEGGLSPRAAALVIEWARLHREALRRNWRAVREGLPPSKIKPLD